MKSLCAIMLLNACLCLQVDAQVQAARSYDVYDSVGVNTHWYFGGAYQYQPQFSSLVALLNGAHIRHFRDGVYAQGTNTPSYLTQMYSTLAANGIHAELIVPQSTTITAAQLEAGLQLYPGIEAIEPPNEWDINGGSTWTSTLLAEEPAILQAGHALGLTVLGPALTQPGSYSQLGNIAQYMDYNNIHAYFGGRNPENGGWGGPDAEGNYYGSLPWNLDLLQMDAPNVQGYATETGYVTTSTPTQNEVPETVEGAYAPRAVMEFFKRGIKRTYIYELIDDPSGSGQQGYGLLRTDLSAKPAFTALSNLLKILQDTNTQFAPESLNYSLTGNMSVVETALFEKSNGDFYLAVWLNGSIYDVNNLVATPIAPQPLTLSVPSGLVVADVSSFNPDGTVTASLVGQSTYTVNANSCLTMIHIGLPPPPAATPAFSVAPGAYASPQSVAISDATSGAKIYYTTNGSTPTTSSSLYSGPIAVNGSETIKAIAAAPGYSTSAIGSAAYSISFSAAVPAFSVPSGSYTSLLLVAISESTPGAQVYYTTDGSAPTANSNVYSSPLIVSSSETINAIAVAPGYGNSAVGSAAYAISPGLVNTANSYVLVNEASGSCVDDGGNLTNGVALTQWQCIPGNKNQYWWLSPAANIGYYEVGDSNSSSIVWTVSNGSTSNNSPLQQSSWAQSRYQQWNPVALSSGYYEFVDLNSGLCLNVPNGATTNGLQLQISTCNGAPSESFVLGSLSSSIASGAWYEVINATSGMCVTDSGSSTSNGTALSQVKCGSLLNQEWQFQPISGGYYAVYNGNATALVWDDTNGSKSNGNGMQLWSWANNSNQQWLPKLQSNGLWTFTNLNSGECLDNAGSTTNGTRMTQWSCLGNANQQFEVVRVR